MTTTIHQVSVPRHVAIIMDGNGRWAAKRGLMRAQGHRQGVEALRKTVENAADFGIEYLTLFSFSSENWSRPQSEVSDLMSLLKMFIRRDLADLHRENIRVQVIGARNDLAPDIRALIEEAENLTASNSGLRLIIAFNYGARDELARAMKKIAFDIEKGTICGSEIDTELISARLDTADIPDPELIIRTSGEMRLSNFLLWQAAYAEFVFVDCHWPDFNREEFSRALAVFYSRDRRFGGIKQEVAS